MLRTKSFWLIVLGAGAILAINMGIRQGFGLFLKPISQDLDLGRQVFALSIALLNLCWGAGAPFAGALSDKFGAVPVVLGGAVLYAGGLLLMASASAEPQLLTAGVLIGLGVSGTGFTAVFGVVARAAPPEKRAAAISFVTMGSAIGQFIALPYVHVLLDSTGWVMALVVLSGTAALMVPLSLALIGAGQQTSGAGAAQLAIPEQGLGAALKEAMKHPSFLLLTAGFFVCGFQIAAVAVHLPAFLTDRGFDPSLGAIALTVIGAANIAGTYLCGRAGEFMPKQVALTLLYLGRGLVFLALIYLPLTQASVLVCAMVLGLFWLGTIPLTSGLIVTFFGPRWLSTLYGIVFFSHQIGSFLGAWLGGWFYDLYQSYEMLWWASIGVSLLAAVLHLPIREAPSPRLVALAAK